MWSNLGLKPIFFEGDVVVVVIDLVTRQLFFFFFAKQVTRQVVKVYFKYEFLKILFTSNALLNNTIQ